MKRIAPLFLILVSTWLGANSLVARQAERIGPDDAKKFRGKTVTLCGLVTDVGCKAGEGSTFRLDAKKSVNVDIRVPESLRPPERRFEDRYLMQTVCATGLVRKTRYTDEVTVDSLDAIVIENEHTTPLFAPDAYRPCDATATLPVVTCEVKPQYSPEPMSQRVQGTVLLEAVVEANGRIGEIRVLKSLHPDLDRNAAAALRAWEFKPGTFMGTPAPILVTVEMTFKL